MSEDGVSYSAARPDRENGDRAAGAGPREGRAIAGPALWRL